LTTEAWRLILAASAERSLDRLPSKVATAIVEFMVGPLIEAPRRVGHPLGRELAGLWSARRGVYRIVYELDEVEKSINVVRIDHRSDVYRPR
jgi:mRNA-degrading endonuclease RelE of RelBE toxin-antitoxin system